MTDIYKKSILIALVLLVTVRSEEISTTRNIKNTDLLNTRLSTNLHLSLYNDEHFTKDNPKRSLHLLMPLSQDEYEKPKEASRKTKRCSLFQKYRFPSPSTKENLTKTRAKNLDKNNVGISKQNSNTHSFRNANYLQKNFITSDKVKAEMHKDEFLRVFKDNTEDETINSESKETKKRNAEKCICYCKEKNCFPESSKKSSSQMLGSSGKNKSARINNRRREKYRNARPDISRQKSLRFFERLHETRIPGPINFFPIRSYQERVIPHVPVLYGIEAKPYVLSHMTENDRKFVNAEIPFTSSHGRPHFLVGSNAYNQYQSIMYRNPYFISEENQIADPVMSATLPSNSVDAATVMETESDPESYDSIEITEKDRKPFPVTEPLYDYKDMSTELTDTKTNFYPDYSTDATTENNIVSFSNLNEMHKPKDSIEIERNQDDNPSIIASLTDYIDTSSIPITYPSLTDDKKFINMEECIKLFGRDVCVLSTSSINGVEKLNANSKDNFESASIESNANVNEAEQIYESDDDQNKSFSSVEDTHIPILQKSKDSTEIERSQDDNLSITSSSITSLTDYIDTSSIPITYPALTDDKKFINMEECIKLFGRDVCVLSTSSINGVEKLNANSKDNFESASIESNANVNEAEQIYESDDDQNKSFSSVEDTHIPILQKSKDSTEIERSQDDNLSITSSLTDYIDTSSIPITYPALTDDKKFINMEECIKLFGRDVCVLSTSSINGVEKLNANSKDNFESASIESNANVNEAEQIYESDDDDDQNKSFSSVEDTHIPILQKSKDSTEIERSQDDNLSITSSSITSLTDYIDTSSIPITYPALTDDKKFINMEECIKLFGRDVCVLSTSSINGVEKLNANSKDNFESASIESNANVNEAEQIYESDDDDDQNKSFSSVEDTHIPIKKLMDQEIPEFTETPRNRVLGKSKSHKLLLTLNNENTANPISGEKFPYSSTPSEFNSEGEVYNLKIDQQNLVTTTNTNFWYDIFNNEESLEEKILQERPQEESATISHNSEIKSNVEEENTSSLNESNGDGYLEQTILQEQPIEKTTIVNPNLETEYDFEETKNDVVKSQTDIYPEEEILREPSTTLQYFDYENSNDLNNEEDTTDTLEAIIDSSTKKLPFCDNSLLLNTIKKVINDFALNTPLGKTKKLDENILQTQDTNLLPEILQVSNLKNILSIPRIENTIVENVKNILSDITAIPKRDFTNNWSHGIIRNTLRNILDNFSDFHQKLPPMTVEEHQFINGQWTVNPVTLASILDNKVSMTNPQNLRESIRELLSAPVIASQIDQQIIRNIIVQSIKNSLINDDEEEKIDDSIIHDALNDVLQALKNSKDTDESDKFVNNGDITSSQETSTDDSEIGINVNDSILNNQQDLDTNKDKKVDNKEMQTTTYQEAKALENNPNQLFAFTPSDLLKSSEEDKNIYIEEKPPNRIIDKIEENIRDQILDGIKKINMQNDEGIKLVEPLKTKITQKAISLNNPRILAISVEPELAEELNGKENKKNILLQTTTVSSITPTNFYETEQNIVNSTPRINDINIQNEEEIKNYPETWNHLIVHHQPNSNQNFESSSEFNANSNSKMDSSRYDEIELPITHGKNNNNKLPINSYSSNNHIVDENVEVTASTDFMQETLPDYTKMPDGIISKNIAEAKDDQIEHKINEKTLTTSADNLISFSNEEYGNQESNIATMVSVDTVHPLIILERIRNKEPPIKYYSPEGLQYIRTNSANDENVKITTSTDFMQGTSLDYVQKSNGVNLQNAAENKDIERETENTSNGKASLNSSDNVILPTNAEYENCKSKIAPSTDKDILESQQQNFATDDNVIKIHEVTTEVQRTYTKTTYFKTQPSTDDRSRITASSLDCEITKSVNNSDSMNKNSNLVDNNYNSTAKGNGLIASSFKPPLSNNTYFLQLFPSSTASDNISELQKSQLYYINDGIKLPLEIKKLKDGSYALLISKNICQQIMKKECPCCVPLQGHVIQELKKTHDQEDKDMSAITTERHYQESTHMNDYERNNQLDDSSPSAIITSMTMNKNILTMQSEEEEESMNRFQKRNLNHNDLTTISMPVIEFVKKYNLLLNEDKMLLDEIESDDKNKNCANLLIKSAKGDETKWHKFEEERKSMQRIGSINQEKNPIPKGIMISGEEIKSKKMNWDKLADIENGNVRVLHNKKKREHKEAEFINDKHNIAEIKIYGKNNARPYRYQRNTNSVTNPRAELVKSVLYWIKSLFVDE